MSAGLSVVVEWRGVAEESVDVIGCQACAWHIDAHTLTGWHVLVAHHFRVDGFVICGFAMWRGQRHDSVSLGWTIYEDFIQSTLAKSNQFCLLCGKLFVINEIFNEMPLLDTICT